jgi:hypothetical protein
VCTYIQHEPRTVRAVLETHADVDHRLIAERVALLEDARELLRARVRADLISEVADRVDERRDGRLGVAARRADGEAELVATQSAGRFDQSESSDAIARRTHVCA